MALSLALCDDPANMDRLGDPMSFLGSASYGQLNEQQVRRMQENPTEGPFYMVNLIRYRDEARYGARVVFNGTVGDGGHRRGRRVGQRPYRRVPVPGRLLRHGRRPRLPRARHPQGRRGRAEGCQAPYRCCRDCNPAVADFLPFVGSACMPDDITAQLTEAPPSCQCD